MRVLRNLMEVENYLLQFFLIVEMIQMRFGYTVFGSDNLCFVLFYYVFIYFRFCIILYLIIHSFSELQGTLLSFVFRFTYILLPVFIYLLLLLIFFFFLAQVSARLKHRA